MADWAVLDRTEPAPGDPFAVQELGRRMVDEAQRTEDSTTRLRSIAAGSGELAMAGDYAAGYVDTLNALPVDLDKLSRAYRGCGDALTTYAGTLTEAKTQAGAALTQGLDADVRYRAAVSEMRNLLPPPQQFILDGGGRSLIDVTVGIATVGMDEATREQVRAAARRARMADDDLDRARRLADQAAMLRERAEDRCVREIDAALEGSGIKDKPWYQKAWDFVATPFKSWDEFVNLCGKVALVAGVAALFISGPVGWALMAAALVGGAVVFADGLNKYSKGEIGLGGLALRALGLIPGGRGVIGLAQLGRQTSAFVRALTTPGGVKALFGALRGGSRVAPDAASGGGRLLWTSWPNYPKVVRDGREYAQIGDRLYTRHAVDRMQPRGLGAPAGAPGPGRSIAPQHLEDVMTSTKPVEVKGPLGEPRLSYSSGSVQVITEDGIVITVITR